MWNGWIVTWTNWQPDADYVVGDLVQIGTQTYQCVDAHTSTTFESDVANWKFFVINIRLKKSPYVVHNPNISLYSPQGDQQFDADFSVDGTSNQIRLTNQLPIGTQITVIKRTGSVWANQYTI